MEGRVLGLGEMKELEGQRVGRDLVETKPGVQVTEEDGAGVDNGNEHEKSAVCECDTGFVLFLRYCLASKALS